MAFVSTSSNKYARQKLPSSYASYSTHDALIAQNTPETEQTSPVSGAGVSTGQKSRTSNSLIAHNGQPHRSMKSTNRVSYTQHPHVSSKPRVLSPDHVSRPIRVPTVMWSKPADQLISHQDGLHQVCAKKPIPSSMSDIQRNAVKKNTAKNTRPSLEHTLHKPSSDIIIRSISPSSKQKINNPTTIDSIVDNSKEKTNQTHLSRKLSKNIWDSIDAYSNLATKSLSSKKDVSDKILKSYNAKLNAQNEQECVRTKEKNTLILNDVIKRKRHIHSSMVKLKEKLEAGKTDVGKRSICHGCQQASINQQRRDIKDCDDIQSYNIIQVKGTKERSEPSHSYPTKNRHKKSTKQSVKTATIENRSSAEIRNLKRLLVNKSVMENLADSMKEASSTGCIFQSPSDIDPPSQSRLTLFHTDPSVAEQNTSLRPPALVLPAWEGTLVNESEISILANSRHKAEVGLNRLDSWARISNGLDAQPSIMNQSEVLQKDGFDSFDSVFTARNDYVEPNKIASHLELFLDNMRRSQRMAEFSGLKENAFKVDPKKMPENMRSECIQIGKSLSSKIIQLVIMYNTYMEYMDDAIAEEKDSV
ncbi:hypothetical protein BASA50_008959 [Batrachochytrium salamandrivorans]|uniref:Uncharacterized protein n=1 Tax=Batrachochytrium salamandrivorans TaxID=1357716 RepID=A0ABQ8F2E8_9FUNG|nr:hypothetical protein BASA60_006743 [Batrachochytrium salamandrivorans]KAH6590959.1 hypothetical protein BASA50_008959 [Batrachochytrium salamandrivorans]KAH9268559.1 hypothetical protein BASA84_000164 [Batrachochytrium salamandrivorans]